MEATLICIGDELLIGQVVNTNASWMAEQLSILGFKVAEIIAIGDNHEDIKTTVDRALKKSQVVLITGGLGPTKDDLTKNALADYFGSELILYPDVLAQMKAYFAKRQFRKLPSVEQLAWLPNNCTILNNTKGLCVGMLFQKENKIVVSMPGVPSEMKAIMTDEVLPRLPKLFKLPTIIHKTLQCAGLGESLLADEIKGVEKSLPNHIKLAYLPSLAIVRLRLSGWGTDAAALQQEMDGFAKKISDILAPKWQFGTNNDTLEATIGQLLLDPKATICTAESCTGGQVAAYITNVSGSSAYFKGSIVAYANEVKQQFLNVPQTTLDKYGAVSEETALAMAAGARKVMQTTYAIATTGVAGPDGGTPTNPVGTVWIAVAGPKGSYAIKHRFARDRETNTKMAVLNGLVFLRHLLLGLL